MEAPKLFSRFRIDILLISPAADILKRTVQISEKFKLSFNCVADFQEYEKNYSEIGRPNLILLDVTDCANQQQAIDRIQRIQNFVVPRCDVVCIVKEDVSHEFVNDIKKTAGAFEVISSSQVTGSVRVDFIILYRFLQAYYPIDIKDLFPGTEITFNVFHFLKLNNKYLPVVFSQFVLSEKKFTRLESISPLFIKREETLKYQLYIENFYDSFKGGLQKRIKASFVQLLCFYSQMIDILVFSRSVQGADKADFLLKTGVENQLKFNNYLKASPNPLLVLYQNYLLNPFLVFDRSPLVVAMASLIATMTGVADPAAVFRAGILTYAGISGLDQLAFLKWHNTSSEQWTEVEKEQFAKYLNNSLALAKAKLQSFDDSTSLIISSMAERFDGHGIPGKLSGDGIPPETQLLQFVERWLRNLSLKAEPSPEMFNLTFQESLADDKHSGRLNPKLIEKIQQVTFYKAA